MGEEAAHILVVDDDKRLRELLRKYLAEQGYRVSVAAGAAEARRQMASLDFNLLVLDIMMPGENGLALTQSLRRTSAVPILLLTAMGEAEDRIAGLDRGADDYLVKPFEPRELVARIRSILRRAPRETPAAREIRFGALTFDPRRRVLRRGPEEIRLTTAELDLLDTLARRPGEAVNRDELAREAGGGDTGRQIDVQVARLRRKIEDNPRFPRYLQTVRGRGYRLLVD
jgi:two-component system phosphate regulon response regulator OmpR